MIIIYFYSSAFAAHPYVVLLYIFRQSFNRSYHTMSGLRVVLASFNRSEGSSDGKIRCI